MGYHQNYIPTGKFGEISKIEEELAELKDAVEQDAKIMILLELADLVGAIEGYLHANFNSLTLDDLIKMKALTASAFESGERSSKQ